MLTNDLRATNELEKPPIPQITIIYGTFSKVGTIKKWAHMK